MTFCPSYLLLLAFRKVYIAHDHWSLLTGPQNGGVLTPSQRQGSNLEEHLQRDHLLSQSQVIDAQFFTAKHEWEAREIKAWSLLSESLQSSGGAANRRK